MLEQLPRRNRLDDRAAPRLEPVRIDVAIEALRDFVKMRPQPDLARIYHYAELDRVQIRPYLEAMA